MSVSQVKFREAHHQVFCCGDAQGLSKKKALKGVMICMEEGVTHNNEITDCYTEEGSIFCGDVAV